MKTRILLFCACFILFTAPITQALFGGGPVPGVDIPIDPGAFWDPDIPDYADDGNVYSLRQLGKGSVYDHRRNVEDMPITMKYLSDVTNSMIHIANQILDLTGMSTEALTAHSTDIQNKLEQADNTVNQSNGLLQTGQTTEESWNRGFKTFASFRQNPAALSESIGDDQKKQTLLDHTYQDGTRVFKNNTQIEQDWQILQLILQQNQSAIGNKHIQQVTGQAQAMKNSQLIQQTQNLAGLATILTAGKAATLQKDLEDRQRTFRSVNIGGYDPYHPTEKDTANFEQPKGQGFIHF